MSLKKLSIRYQLLFYMLASVAFFAILLFIANIFLVENYYLSQKKKELLKNSEKIEGLLNKYDANALEGGELNADDFEMLEKLRVSSGQTFLVANKSGETVYPLTYATAIKNFLTSALDRDSIDIGIGIDIGIDRTLESINGIELITGMDTAYSNGKITEAADEADFMFTQPSISIGNPIGLRSNETTGGYKILPGRTDDAFFAISETKLPSIEYATLIYKKSLSNGLVMELSIPMSFISEGVDISNRFTTIIGVIVICVTALWAFFVSSKFTKPVMEINNITKKMKMLDFTQVIEINGSGELAELSENINSLSNQLDMTITELNIKNKRLEKDIDKERKIDSMRKEFISNVSHELKTPIFLIQGYAEGLKVNTMNSEKRDFYCGVISEEADKMDTLVHDLLILSKLESDAINLDKSEFDMKAMIENLLDKYDCAFGNKNMGVTFESGPNLITYADKSRIEQVITNLLNNAIDHISGGMRLRVIAEKTNDGIKVSVFNTGQNIPELILDKIWESFYKADVSHTRDVGGAGLGLSIVRAILRAHEAAYGVANEENGVTFWFCIPNGPEIFQL